MDRNDRPGDPYTARLRGRGRLVTFVVAAVLFALVVLVVVPAGLV